MKLYLTVVLATLAACSAHIGGRQHITQDLDPHVYCGRRLAKMLATVCDYDERDGKRSGSGSMLQPILAPYYEAQEQYGWPFVTSQKPKNRESYSLPQKTGPQTDWFQKSEYTWPLKSASDGLLYHKTKESEDWPWITAHKARGFDLPSRSKRYVVNECCEKPCTVEELSSYC